MTCLGLDIGGANLKAADGVAWAESVPFPLWQRPNDLAAALICLIDKVLRFDRIAVTMTGELCDCFRTKPDGVRHILRAVDEAARGRPVGVYLVGGQIVTTDAACELPHRAAASNWHALATFACRFTSARPALLIDIGSTTSDLIPLGDGQVRATGMTDTERLITGELVYTGIGRTPICAVTQSLPWRNRRCPLVAELFATTADAYVLLGDLAEVPDALWTADGRPLTRQFSQERLARMICADLTQFDENDAWRAAESVRDAQVTQLRDQLSTLISAHGTTPDCFVISGSGEFLAKRLATDIGGDARIVSISELLGGRVSVCAAAHAVAVLAQEASEA